MIVDALFGTGLDRDLAGLHAAVVDAINQAPAHRVALDLPSGLDANTGRVLGVAVQAQDTVTFGALKLGLVTPNGAALGGHVHVAGLGVPTSMIDHAGWSAEVILRSHVASLLTPRGARTHKHAEGSVLAFAGDSGKLGAALLVEQRQQHALAAGASEHQLEDDVELGVEGLFHAAGKSGMRASVGTA